MIIHHLYVIITTLYIYFHGVNCNSWPGVYDNSHLTPGDCSISINDVQTHESDTTSKSAGDWIHALGWVAIDLLSIKFEALAAPFALVGHSLEAFGFWDVFEEDETEQMYEIIAASHNNLWNCTKDYVDAQNQAVITEIWGTNYDAVHNSLDRCVNKIKNDGYLPGDDAEVNLANILDDTNGLMKILTDLVNKFHDTTTTSNWQCRAIMMDVYASITIYLESFGILEELWNIVNTTDTDRLDDRRVDTKNLREYIGELMVLFKDCAPKALYSILRESDTSPHDEIASEAQFIYDSFELICFSVNVLYEMTIPENNYIDTPYIFNIEYGEKFDWSDFSIDKCSAAVWVDFIVDNMNDMFNMDKQMYVTTLWPLASSVLDKSLDWAYNTDPYLVDKKADCPQTVDVTEVACDDVMDVKEMYYAKLTWIDHISYYNSTVLTKADCKECFRYDNSVTGLKVDLISCPHDSAYEIISGARYMVNDEYNIIGMEIICSDPLNLVNYDTESNYYITEDTYYNDLLMNMDDSIEYEWGPWYLCPPGYYVKFKPKLMDSCSIKSQPRTRQRCRQVDGCAECYETNYYDLHAEDSRVDYECEVIDMSIIPIYLTNIGDEPEKLLLECEGDCDNDDECSGDLKCYQRDNGDVGPPGCEGIPTGGYDYCYDPIYLTDIGDEPSILLLECEGDCDNDDECSGDLKCYQRDNGDVGPPGCKGSGTGGYDYCYDPINYNLNDIDVEPSILLLECEGDCDSDDECNGNLKCYQRDDGDSGPPGCKGSPTGGWDYCYNPIYLTNIGDEPEKLLLECEGDCDSDDECNGNLKCYQRDDGDSGPPGCIGVPKGGYDYCYNENKN